jgi:phosphate transport system protein
VTEELRTRFRQDLANIDRGVVQLFALVSESVSEATEALFAPDDEAIRGVTGKDAVVDGLELELEDLTERLLLTQSPMSGDMRYLVTVLRIVPQLERCADLAEHVARRGATGLASRLPAEVRDLLSAMGARCVAMWREAGRAWVERDEHASARLDEQDDELDRQHDALTAALVEADLANADLMQATLVGRFYERLGDHAVHLTERICYVKVGRQRTHAPPA